LPQTLRRVLATAVATTALLVGASDAMASQGKVNFAKAAQSDLENVGIGTQQSFISSKYWRVRAYPPSWNNYLSWFSGAWGYKDAYAIYNPDAYPAGHITEAPPMDQVLKDAGGRPLYIPYDCNGTRCTQYAADMGNPDFRRRWIDQAKAYVSSGYKGVFVDDMTLYPRVSDAAGNSVRPIDPRTGQPMTDDNWARYAAEFMEQLRAEIKAIRPDAELVFNVLWYAPSLGGPQDAYVKRLIAASDHLEIERGYTDTHPGTGQFGWETAMKWVDYAHSRGKGIVADSYTTTRSGAEYELANSLLMNDGRDSMSTGYGALPTNWWSGYDTDLGAAKGARYAWHGGYRRDFDRGSVVVAPPGTTVSGSLSTPLVDLNGNTRSSISLTGTQGIVLKGATAPVLVVQPLPNPRPADTAPQPQGSGKPPKKQGARTAGRMRRTVLVRGRVARGKQTGRVKLYLQRRVNGHWKHARSATVRIRGGRFRRTFRRLERGRYRVKARYVSARHTRTTRRFLLRY
jgi:hypothetical protein